MANSPIYDGFATPPSTYPLGVPIAHKVDVREIPRRTADRIYEAHHSYMPTGRCGWHYGVYLDGQIVGAISFDNWFGPDAFGHEADKIYEVSRACIAHDTPNLASCGMGKAQDEFLDTIDEIELLVTWVREDYAGSMFAALGGKGWTFDGESRDSDYPNREDREIHDWDKERWICEV